MEDLIKELISEVRALRAELRQESDLQFSHSAARYNEQMAAAAIAAEKAFLLQQQSMWAAMLNDKKSS
jgi:hypothetical protein